MINKKREAKRRENHVIKTWATETKNEKTERKI